MKKGQETGKLDKEAVGRITSRILQEEDTGGMLVKRPLVVGKDFVLAGFREKEWQEKLL